MLKKPALLVVLIASALLAVPGHSAGTSAKKNKDVTTGKVLVQSLGGVGVGLLGGLAGWGIGNVLGSAHGEEGGIDGGYVWGFYGAFAGYAAGTVGGISWIGHKQGLQGSTALTLIGNLAGQALALWIRTDLNNSTKEGAVLFGIPMALSLAAYDGSHWVRHRNDVASAGLETGGPIAMGAQPYRLEVVKFTF